MKSDGLTDQLVVLVGFLLSSARGLADEPRSYAVFRLLDAAGRLLDAMEEHGLLDESLNDIKAQVDRNRYGSGDEDELLSELDELVVRWVRAMPSQ